MTQRPFVPQSYGTSSTPRKHKKHSHMAAIMNRHTQMKRRKILRL